MHDNVPAFVDLPDRAVGKFEGDGGGWMGLGKTFDDRTDITPAKAIGGGHAQMPTDLAGARGEPLGQILDGADDRQPLPKRSVPFIGQAKPA
jgi:hypothetical protein